MGMSNAANTTNTSADIARARRADALSGIASIWAKIDALGQEDLWKDPDPMQEDERRDLREQMDAADARFAAASAEVARAEAVEKS